VQIGSGDHSVVVTKDGFAARTMQVRKGVSGWFLLIPLLPLGSPSISSPALRRRSTGPRGGGADRAAAATAAAQQQQQQQQTVIVVPTTK
jgi:hypothetical protein